jgi:transcriptional repressor p66
MDLSSIPEGLTIIPTTVVPTSNNTTVAVTPAPIPSVIPAPPTMINPASSENNGTHTESRYPSRRVLRPRTEPRSYAEIESPDINFNNGTEKSANGEYESDDDDEDVPMPLVEIKELSAAEIWERERKLRKLREELRNEETKLILLKKIKHSQQVMKENKTPANLTHSAQNLSQTYNNPLGILPQSLSSKGSLTVIPTNLISDYKNSRSQSSHNDTASITAQCFPLPRGQALPGGATLTTGTSSRAPFIQGKTVGGLEGRSSSNLTITPSVTITPTTGPMNMKAKNVRKFRKKKL